MKAWWPLVRAGVEDVIAKTNPSFIPEDVYMTLMANPPRARLILTFTPGNVYAGFTIIGAETDPFSQRSSLMIWLAYGVPGMNKVAEFTDAAIAEVGKKLGFDYQVMHSPRLGWDRRAPQLGYSLREQVWHKSLR